MKKRMIAIAVCSLLMLTACNKSTETVTETADTTVAAVSSETTTAEIIAETSAAPAETTAAETTAQSEEKTLSAEELEKQIAAAEELLEKMKEEEAAQTADVEYEVIDPFEFMSIMAADSGIPELEFLYCAGPITGIVNKKYPYANFSYNVSIGDGKPEIFVYANVGDEITVTISYDEERLKEDYNAVIESTTMKFTAWNPDEKGDYIYIENGEICYTNSFEERDTIEKRKAEKIGV